MLAQGVQLDVLDDDHLAAVTWEQGIVHYFAQIQPIATGKKLHGLGSALGCIE